MKSFICLKEKLDNIHLEIWQTIADKFKVGTKIDVILHGNHILGEVCSSCKGWGKHFDVALTNTKTGKIRTFNPLSDQWEIIK